MFSTSIYIEYRLLLYLNLNANIEFIVPSCLFHLTCVVQVGRVTINGGWEEQWSSPSGKVPKWVGVDFEQFTDK